MGLQSAGQHPILVPLTKLYIHPRVWPRQRLDHERVAMFAALYEEGGPNALPPVEAVRATPRHLVDDGAHRLDGAFRAGLGEVPVVLLDPPEAVDPIQFAYLQAIAASTRGAKQLTRVEIHVGIRRLISETDLRDDQIAPLFGVSKATVWRERRKATDHVSSETDAPDAGEAYIAQVTAGEVATRLFKALGKVYESRGLGIWDALTGRNVGDRLADVLANAYGEKAAAQAERFRSWIDDAIASLSNGGDR